MWTRKLDDIITNSVKQRQHPTLTDFNGRGLGISGAMNGEDEAISRAQMLSLCSDMSVEPEPKRSKSEEDDPDAEVRRRRDLMAAAAERRMAGTRNPDAVDQISESSARIASVSTATSVSRESVGSAVARREPQAAPQPSPAEPPGQQDPAPSGPQIQDQAVLCDGPIPEDVAETLYNMVGVLLMQPPQI